MCHFQSISTLSCLPASFINILLRLYFISLNCKINQQFPPLIILIIHVNFSQKFRPTSIIGTTPTTNSGITQFVGFIKINTLSQYIKPYIKINPINNRRNHGLLCNFWAIAFAVIFISTCRFTSPNTIKRQNIGLIFKRC